MQAAWCKANMTLALEDPLNREFMGGRRLSGLRQPAQFFRQTPNAKLPEETEEVAGPRGRFQNSCLDPGTIATILCYLPKAFQPVSLAYSLWECSIR